jgi:hypothetical protein
LVRPKSGSFFSNGETSSLFTLFSLLSILIIRYAT